MAEGKSAEAVFVFTPIELGTFEAFFVFEIERYELKASFLMVGVAREPRIYFGRTHVELAPTTIGVAVTSDVKLINDEEEEEFRFRFIKESFVGDSGMQVVQIEPNCGILAPKSEYNLK